MSTTEFYKYIHTYTYIFGINTKNHVLVAGLVTAPICSFHATLRRLSPSLSQADAKVHGDPCEIRGILGHVMPAECPMEDANLTIADVQRLVIT